MKTEKIVFLGECRLDDDTLTFIFFDNVAGIRRVVVAEDYFEAQEKVQRLQEDIN